VCNRDYRRVAQLLLYHLLQHLVAAEINAGSCLVHEYNLLRVKQSSRNIDQLLFPCTEVLPVLRDHRVQSVSRSYGFPQTAQFKRTDDLLVLEFLQGIYVLHNG
jgi:hypothetical protein